MDTLVQAPSMEVVKLNVTDAEIARLREYMSLVITSIDDKIGYKKVYEARQIVKKTRTGVEKYAKELKETALAWQRKVNSEKDRIVGELEQIEAYLQEEEDKVEAEKERIRQEEEAKEVARIQARIDALATYGFAIDYATITVIDDDTFGKVLENAKQEHQKELARKAEEERLAAEEAARIKAEREELEKLRAEQAESQRIIKEQNERIAKEQAEKEAAIRREEQRIEREKEAHEARVRAEEKKIEDAKRAAEQQRLHEERVAKEREEAAEQARLKAIEDARRETEQKAQNERLAKIESDRQAALRPDKEKLQSFSDAVGALVLPSVTDPAAQEIVNEVQVLLNKIQAHVIKRIKSL